MDKLAEVKADIRRGRLRIADINWLVTEVESQKQTIKELKTKTRFKSYMDMAKENLALEDSLKNAREQRDHYKQAYEDLMKAL